MEDNNRSILANGTVNQHVIYSVLGAAIIGVTIYLTNHYFEVLYPTSISGGTLCDINSFFNCDAATHSAASNIFGVPISVFGLMLGIFVLGGYAYRKPEVEGTLYFISAFNLVGCIALFVYSIAGLGSLCPFCTVYYILSAGLFLLLHKKSDCRTPSVPVLAVYGVLVGAASGISLAYQSGQEANQGPLAQSLIDQFNSLKVEGQPEMLTPHFIHGDAKTWETTPIKLAVFSDFECPACGALSGMMHPIAKRFRDKITIAYYFYPLDHQCNENMKRPLHYHACKAAYVAHCSGDKFAEVHDVIFEKQRSLSDTYLEEYAKELGVSECIKSDSTKDMVKKLIEVGNKINVRSTPSMLLNGKKLEGAIPLNQMFLLLQKILEQSNG